MNKNSATYQNFAFISYSHRDMGVAKWLQKRLERFKLPTEIHNEIDAKSRYLRPVFRDQSDLNTGILGDELRKNLEESKFLILICSKNSAQSQWVSDEAKAFTLPLEMQRIEQSIPPGRKPCADVKDWIKKLDNFLKLTGKELLTHAGSISAEMAKEKANLEYDRFKERTRKQLYPVEIHFIKSFEAERKKLNGKK